MVLQSFLVYTITALCLFALGRNVASRDNYMLETTGTGVRFFSLEIILFIVLFALIAGVRYNVGVDHLSYLGEYLKLQTQGSTKRGTYEFGFLAISKFFASSGVHYVIYFAFFSALQIGFICYALRRNKPLLPFIGLCIMLGPYFLDWMNGIRQCLVACAFILMMEFIEKKKLWYYVIAICLATTIHKSAIILLPVYFLIDRYHELPDRKLNIAILALCVAIGATPTWLHLLNSLEKLLLVVGYDAYADGLQQMTSTNLKNMAWGPSRISIFLNGVFLIWYYPGMKDFYNNDKKITLYFTLFFVGICAYNLLANTSHIFLRPVGYFTIFTLPLTAYLFYYLISQAKSVKFYILIALVCSNTYIAIYKAIVMPSTVLNTTLYKFFWDYL